MFILTKLILAIDRRFDPFVIANLVFSSNFVKLIVGCPSMLLCLYHLTLLMSHLNKLFSCGRMFGYFYWIFQ